MKTIGTVLIAIALIAVVVGCEGEIETYNLIMVANPAGTGNATDETGGSPYRRGIDVDIKAVADDCYRFVSWSAPAGIFGNFTSAETTFTMPAQDVTITANFELTPSDHLKFYVVDFETAPQIVQEVQLEDQFVTINATVGYPILFGNPVEKVHDDEVTPISDPDLHYTLYVLEYEQEPESWRVTINNQFGNDQQLTIIGPAYLAVPTLKEGHEDPACLKHFLVYEVFETEFPEVDVHLKDEFGEGDDVVQRPVLFANPVRKTHDDNVTEIENPNEHLVFYEIQLVPFEKRVQIDNQFGPQTLDLDYTSALAVPSQKLAVEQPLNHFKTYLANWMAIPPPTFPVEVQLEDQFGAITANITDPILFANPVRIWRIEGPTPIFNHDNHLTFYALQYADTPPVWYVQIDNQFGIGQSLWVTGPSFLAVPTQKGDHDPPEDIDHFLVYEVIDSADMHEVSEMWLTDQWMSQWANQWPMLLEPTLFANPVQKIHGTEVTDIQNSGDHLVFYRIDGGSFVKTELPITNQFGSQFLYVYQGESDMLGVPSQKIEWSLVPPP